MVIFKQSALAAILFFKIKQEKMEARTSHGLFLHSEALGTIIIREI